MTQAQADLEQLRTAKIEVVSKGPSRVETHREDLDSKGIPRGEVSEAGDKLHSGTDSSFTPALTPTPAAILNRLASSTTHLQQSLQSTFQSTLASASSNPALANPTQLRAQLAENLRLSSAAENLQLSMKQAERLAEEYMRKSDRWVKDAEKWVGEAVKVLPPEGQETRHVGMSWDGSDWYSFSTSPTAISNTGKLEDSSIKKQQRSSQLRQGIPLASSRKEALLRRLREDKELLLVNPAANEETEERREVFQKWIANDWPIVVDSGRNSEEGQVGGIRMALGISTARNAGAADIY